MLGNDIVDISYCEPPKYHQVGYLDRVCTREEADAVRRSASPVRGLAVVWAAKEAAYKLMAKQFPQCRFIPRQFVVQIENRDPARFDQNLSILYAGVQTEVSLFAEERWVHAVAVASLMKVHWVVREIEKCFLGSRQANNESEAVRFLANGLLEELGVRDVSLQFDGKVPKLKRKDGSHSGMDVSLAHHGAFAAAAITWPGCYPQSRIFEDAGFAEMKNSEAACFTFTA